MSSEYISPENLYSVLRLYLAYVSFNRDTDTMIAIIAVHLLIPPALNSMTKPPETGLDMAVSYCHLMGWKLSDDQMHPTGSRVHAFLSSCFVDIPP